MAQIEAFENVSLVSFRSVDSDKTIVTSIFERAALAGINVDMISLSTLTSNKVSLGFTFSDDDLVKLLAVLKDIRREYDITPHVNSSNAKIIIKSEEMVDEAGFASKVFSKLTQAGTEILLVTTGVDEISILIRGSDLTDTMQILENL